MDKYQKLIKSASLQTGIKKEVGKIIMDNFFKKLREVLKEGNKEDPDSFKNARIFKLGIFYSQKDKRDKYRKRTEYARKNKIQD